ncbi:hypothetical protein B5M09_013818 [Aphanomyces astaci]|uniref:EF-hand domain-containing protein n=1 Tax=Aphanomyces astaci TaxID=112090 RepID=A0A3R7XRG0_APHAT|nr:hypothetical protein B5M09_013818 [Aphanomyces astaci]
MTTYNKVDNQGALMGNWVEEEALRRDTGSSRYKPWSPKEGMGRSHPRVIAHSDAVDAKEYKASSKVSSFADFAVPSTVGPRERRRLEELHAQAKAIKEHLYANGQDKDVSHESTNQASYKAYDPAYVAHGVVRVPPRGRGGFKDFDASIVGKTRGEVAAMDAANLQSHAAALPHQATVTRYSHAVTSGSELGFALSAAEPNRNPFGKSTAFTNDILDIKVPLSFIKESVHLFIYVEVVHGEASEPGAEATPGIGINIQARAAALKLKQGLLLASPGELTVNPCESKTNMLVDKRRALVRLADSTTSISFTEFCAGLHQLGLAALPPKDMLHQVFMYLDKDQVGQITWTALLALLNVA